MLKVVVALMLLAHGIGHSMGLMQIFRVATVNPAWHGDSWLLTGAGTTATQVAGGLIWTAAIVGFMALAAALLGWLPSSWITPLGIGSATVSLVGLLLFPVAFPVFSTMGALAVDVAVLVATVWYQLLATDPA